MPIKLKKKKQNHLRKILHRELRKKTHPPKN